ncbi:transcriptional regulator [Rhizocola hellebori]|uniref:Transcriptional regulator n=1 Tax=Rhizocola hellebori TaxID=1392758 RepID=A0A8J3VF73_9ACTN|nr:helix-turn-helix domain-containing protein [Rhizocola hellebori]GIH03852.1 transcriptional regulator [Rhizocola hellebori]
MLRIVFTSEDLARLKVRTTPDPLWDLVLSIHMLRGQPGDLLFRDWRRRTAAALRVGLGPGGRLLSDLIPTMGYFPDFLNPAAAEHGLAHGLETIRSTPIKRLRSDLGRMRLPTRTVSDARLLHSGDPVTLGVLTKTMQAYYDMAIVPYLPVLNTATDRDRRIRGEAILGGGVRTLLESLQPLMAYSDGELRIPNHPHQVIHLEGRGLTLVPSYFCVRHPITLFDAELPPVLIYPCTREQGPLLLPNTVPHRNLAALIGSTRAAILATVGSGTGTMDLARRLGISPANASEHLSVLRDSGLITSHRVGARVVHEIAGLGVALLEGPR